MGDQNLEFELEASTFFSYILTEASNGEFHPYSVAKACMDTIIFLGERLPLEERVKLAELLSRQLDDFVIEDYNEEGGAE